MSFPAEIYDYSIFAAPISYCPIKQTTELCQKSKQDLILKEPSLWNSTNVNNPCAIYFCKRLQGYNETILHYSAHRYCIQCIDTQKEGLNISQNCTLLDKTYCNVCSSESTCIYYDKNFPLCYHHKENTFYIKDDATHIHLLKFNTLGYPISLLTFNLFLFLLILIFVILPSLKGCYLKIKYGSLSPLDLLLHIFQLQNITKMMILFGCISFIVGGFIDIFIYLFDGTQESVATSLSGYLSTFLIILGINSLIFHWIHLMKLMGSATISGNQSLRYILLYLVFLIIIFFFGAIAMISFILYRIIDKGRRILFIYFLSSVVTIIMIIGIILMISLMILSIRMLIILKKIKESNVFEVAIKLKVIFSIF